MTSDLSARGQPCPVDRARLGRAEIAPTGAFPVLAVGTWTIRHTVGDFGIDDGGRLLVCFPTATDAFQPQVDDPTASGYVTASTDGQARLEVRFEVGFWVRPRANALVITVRDGSLRSGDLVTVTAGDTTKGSPGWRLQSFPERHHVLSVLVDAFGTGEFYPLVEQPEIEIVPGSCAGVEVVCPTSVPIGKPVTAQVRACDACGNPTPEAEGLRARITAAGGNVDGLPTEVTLQGPVTPVGPITFREVGVRRLLIACTGAERQRLDGTSNPIKLHERGPETAELLWADMHGQTRETVGTGTVEDYFAFARDRALLDVCAWQGNDFQVTDALWHHVGEQTARFNEAGRFVTFLGYEWSGLTPAGGDHNILFLRDGASLHRSSHWQIHDGSDAATDRYPISELWREFKGRDDVLAVAHVGGRHADLETAAEGFPQLVEIHSHHGTFEWIAEEAMRRGLRVGFVGQSDDHTGRPGLSGPLQPMERSFVTFPVTGGLTGIYAAERSREPVWRALRARHCYATTGRRSLLRWRLGDAMMGDVVTRPRGAELTFTLDAAADGAEILHAEILRDDEVAWRHQWPGDERSPWICLQWSGVRVRSRNKVTDWNGRITVSDGPIAQFRPIGYSRSGEGITRSGDSELMVRSSTAGDTAGILLRLEEPKTRIAFHSARGTFRFRAGEVGPCPTVWPAGGVNQRVAVSRVEPDSRSRDLRLEWTETAREKASHAYWVRLLQMDGHMAWSSPIFVESS